MASLKRITVLTLGCSMLLAGCSGNRGFEDLDAFMTEVKNRPRGTIEPLPEFQVYKSFAYSSAVRRAPFSPPIVVSTVAAVDEKEASKVKPDFDRPKELLESFSLSDLKMVGTLKKVDENTLWGLIADNEGGVHRVMVGQYMGKNYGRITLVEQSQINLLEIVPNGQGGWLERPRTISLDERQL